MRVLRAVVASLALVVASVATPPPASAHESGTINIYLSENYNYGFGAGGCALRMQHGVYYVPYAQSMFLNDWCFYASASVTACAGFWCETSSTAGTTEEDAWVQVIIPQVWDMVESHHTYAGGYSPTPLWVLNYHAWDV